MQGNWRKGGLRLLCFKKNFSILALTFYTGGRELKMSQETLATLSGVSRSRISDIERGSEPFKLSSLMLIAKALNIDYRELLK